MIVYFAPDTLTPYHVVEHYPEDYVPNQNEHWFAQEQSIPLPEMYLARDAQGVISALRRSPAPAIVPPSSLQVGVEAVFTAVPAGLDVLVNGARLATTDASGTLDLTPQTAGIYVIRFESPTSMPKEFTLEAVS